MGNRGTWRGRITRGRLRGYEVEVRVSGEPIPIYVIAYQAPDRGALAPIGFAVGDEALRGHFSDLEAMVEWQEPTPSRRQVGRRSMATRSRARSTFVRRLIHRPGPTDASPPSHTDGVRSERG